jgi:exopolyphosphatase/guanosine-5'-triphosphate,3'-diphosphate pyrophosphatase
VVLACIDIGSNTTRLLVAEVTSRHLRELASERAFTRIGKSLVEGGAIPARKIEETLGVVAAQAARARELGAEQVVAVATAAIREARNRAELEAAVESAGGNPLWVLSGDEEARLSFVGATRTLGRPVEGPVAVVDVGGGSTELAIGDPGGEVQWARSLGVGSGLLADLHLHADPPSAEELDALRSRVEDEVRQLSPPFARSALAVGGTATSMGRLVGRELSHETLERGIGVLAQSPIAQMAERFQLDPERVRLLPAGILVLQVLSDRLGLKLEIARGGLREGVLLELAGQVG